MKRSVAARRAPHAVSRDAGHGLRGAILPGDTVYCRHPTRGPVVVKVLADGAHGLTGEAEGLGRVRVPWHSVLGIRQRMTAGWSVVEQGGDGAILEAGDGRRHFIRGDLAAAGRAPLREQERDDEDDDPLLGRLGPDGAPVPRHARDRREDSKIAAAADTDGDGVVEGVDEGDPAHRGTPGQRSRGADRKVRREAGGAALAKALAGDAERNPPGSAERRGSAFHEAGHAIASFALDSMLHGRG